MRQLVAVLLFVLPLASIAWAQVNPLPKLPPKPHPPTPRLASGVPNLGPTEPNKGYWHLSQFQDYKQILIHPKEIPYQPWARALAMQRRAELSKYDPQGYCMPPSGPRLMTTPFPMEILQLPEQKRIVMIYEGGTHIWRVIYMDGPPASQTGRVEPDLARALGRALGGRHPCRGRRWIQRGWLDRHGRRSAHRSPAHRRALHPEGPLHAALRGDHRRSGRLHRTMDHRVRHRVGREG